MPEGKVGLQGLKRFPYVLRHSEALNYLEKGRKDEDYRRAYWVDKFLLNWVVKEVKLRK